MESDSVLLDTSALLEILLGGDHASRLSSTVQNSSNVVVGSHSYLEAVMVYSRVSSAPMSDLDGLLVRLGANIVSFDGHHGRAAGQTFLRYGKGRHPAALNYGDCMSYAIAKIGGYRLLYVGADLSQTDLA